MKSDTRTRRNRNSRIQKRSKTQSCIAELDKSLQSVISLLKPQTPKPATQVLVLPKKAALTDGELQSTLDLFSQL